MGRNTICLILMILLFSWHPVPAGEDPENRENFDMESGYRKIEGTILNKLSKPLKYISLQLFRDNSVVGTASTDTSGFFSLVVIDTWLGKVNKPENQISLSGPNPFTRQTSFLITLDQPGELMASDLAGNCFERMILGMPGQYRIRFGGMKNKSGVCFMSLRSGAWKETIKLVQTGQGNLPGLSVEKMQQFPTEPGFVLKFAGSDTLKISGRNVTPGKLPVSRSFQDLQLGKITVNQGPERKADRITKTTTAGSQLETDLNEYVYNDDQSKYSARNQNFTISANKIQFTTNITGNCETWVDITDGEDAALKDSILYQVAVSSNPNTAPVISDIPDDSTNEDAPKQGVTLDDYVNDDFTSDEKILWTVSVDKPELLDVTIDANRKVQYNPKQDKNGIVNITYTANDEEGLNSRKTQKFTINPVDDTPRNIVDIVNQSNPEDLTLTFSVASNFNEPDGESLTYKLLNLPSGWTSTWSGSNVNVIAPADYNGTIAGLVVEASDPQGNKVQSKVFSITKTAVNDAPVAVNDNASTDYQTAKNDMDVAANDSDVDGDLVKTSTYITQAPTNGTASVGADGKIDYTPNNGFTGTDIIKYKIKDSNNASSNEATLAITVGNAPNQRPVANNDNVTTNEDTPITIDVVANDTDDGGLDPASVSVIVAPAHGSTSVNATNGKITYTPAADNHTDVTFQYKIADYTGLKDTATVSVVINPVDDAPRFTGSVANQSNLEDVILTFGVGSNFNEPDGEALTYQLLNLPAGWNQSWSGANVSVSAPADYNGSINNIKVEAKDPQNNAVQTNTFTITKTPVDDAPRKVADIVNQTNPEDLTLSFSVAGKFYEPDGEALTYQLLNLPAGWTSTWSGENVNVSAPADYNGTITGLVVKASDPQNNSVQSNTFSITKTAVDDAPRFSGTIANQSNAEDITLTFSVASNYIEPDGEALTYQLLNLPAGWTSTWSGANLSVTAPADYNGTISGLVVQAKDPQNNSVQSNSFTITKTPVDDVPRYSGTIANQSNLEDVVLTFDVAGKFTDPEGLALTYNLLNLPAGWSSTWSGSTVSVTAPADYNGTISGLTVQAKDPGNNTVSSNTFSITKTAVDDAPRFAGTIANQSNAEDVTLTFSVAGYFNEPDGEALTYQLLNLPAGWSSTWSGTNVNVSAPADYNGTITGLVVKASDPQSNYVQSNTFNITKTAVDDAPRFSGTIPNQTNLEDVVLTFDVAGKFSDPEGLALTYSLLNLPAGWSSTWSGTQASVTAPADYNGTINNIQVEAKDPGNNAAQSNTFTITKTAVDDAPRLASNIVNQSNAEDITLTFSVASNFTEPDGEALTYTLLNLPAGWSSNWSGSNASVIAPANYNGTISGLTVKAKDPQNNEVTSNSFTITKTPVNDPVTFSGTIDNIVLNKGSSATVDLKNYFQDVEYTDLQLSYALAGLSLGTYSITDGVLTITGTTAGSETDLRASASDEGTSANSNYFGLIVNEVAQKSIVTFNFKDASTNTQLASGTSTLKYKLTGTGAWTADSTKTSTNGVISLPLLDGRTYEVEIDHSSKLGTYCAFALRRPGDLEPFDQQDAVDKYQAITVTAGGDNIGAYVLMNDFPIVDFLLHAGDGGTRKVNPSNDMTIWWNLNYGAPTADQRQWITDFKNQIATIPFVTVTLPYVESTTAPAGVKLEIRINASPGNSTTLDANNYITGATALFPVSTSQRAAKVEINQAFLKLNDSAGDPPFFDTNGNLNTTGKKCYAVSYNFRPKTTF